MSQYWGDPETPELPTPTPTPMPGAGGTSTGNTGAARINLFIDGDYGRGITDICDVAEVTLENEKKSFQFIASEFNFTLKNGSWLYNRLAGMKGATIDVRISDGTKDYFNGSLDAEGADYDDENGKFNFQALDRSRALADAWATTPAAFDWFRYDAYPADYLEYSLNRNAVRVVLPKDFVHPVTFYDYSQGPYKARNYSALQLINDAAKYMSAVWTVRHYKGYDLLVFTQRDRPAADHWTVYNSGIWKSVHRLRAADYQFVCFDADDGKSYLESRSYFRPLADGEDVDTSKTLDLRMTRSDDTRPPIEFTGKDLFTVLFTKRKPVRQNIWNYLFQTKEQHDVGVIGLLDAYPTDAFNFGGPDGITLHGPISKVVYNLINETSLITYDRSFE